MPAPPLSVLDLSPVVEGASAADSFQPSLAFGELRLGKPASR